MFQLAWAVNALQSDNYTCALPYLKEGTFSPAAINVEDPSEHSIHKWEIESIVNETLTTEKQKPRRGKVTRYTSDDYRNFLICVNRLRRLENKEFKFGGHNDDVLGELVRIANRQFPWQIGTMNMANFYRSTFIYGQGECSQAFEERYGISIADFQKVSLALCGHLMERPFFAGINGMQKIGISSATLKNALDILCIQIDRARKLARTERQGTLHIAYKPSILRQYPCVNFSRTALRIKAPLPQLIIDRMTTGLFYDLVGEGGAVRNEYGKRFEEYCLNYSQAAAPFFDWQAERSYRIGGQQMKSTDLLCFDSGRLLLVGECKATRMSRESMFGRDLAASSQLDELVKAVKQIWRFFAHCRLGRTGIENVEAHAVGAVVTLDNWLVMAHKLRAEVLSRAATEIAEFSNGLVIPGDMRPIAFFPIQQMERVMSSANAESFKELLSTFSNEKYLGWNLDMIHSELDTYDPPKDPTYPFRDRLGELVPWWNDIPRD